MALGNSDSGRTGRNWSGGVAPSGTVGTLSFPKLKPGCLAFPTTSCYSTENDISGLNVGAMSIDDSVPYYYCRATVMC